MPLDKFAAAVAATDLLLTVDTMAAHCAGRARTSGMAYAAFFAALVLGQSGENHTPWYPIAPLFRRATRRDCSHSPAVAAGELSSLSIKYD